MNQVTEGHISTAEPQSTRLKKMPMLSYYDILNFGDRLRYKLLVKANTAGLRDQLASLLGGAR